MSVGDLNPRTLGDLELIEQEAPKRGIWHRPPKSKKKQRKHERQHPTSRNTQARDLASPSKKAKKRTQTRKAGADEEETPKRGIWHRPQKRPKKNPNTKGYAKPFCSDGGSVILSTLITAPQTGLHPPCLLVFLISLSFSFASSRWNNFPLPSQRQHRLWRNRKPMKIKEI